MQIAARYIEQTLCGKIKSLFPAVLALFIRIINTNFSEVSPLK